MSKKCGQFWNSNCAACVNGRIVRVDFGTFYHLAPKLFVAQELFLYFQKLRVHIGSNGMHNTFLLPTHAEQFEF